MSSNDESDDDFQSADEDIDFEPQTVKTSEEKNGVLSDFVDKNVEEKSDKLLPHLDELKLESTEDICIEGKNEFRKLDHSLETPIESHNQLDSDTTQFSSKDINKFPENIRQIADKCDANNTKPVIKGRKILRKAERLKEETNSEESDNKEIKAIESKEKCSETLEPKQEIRKPFLKSKEKICDKREDIETENINNEIICENVDKFETKEEKTIIKGRKLMRKADRLREETNSEESNISEEKKFQILNKLSDLSPKDDTSSKWNNWFSDIKSAAITATSTTASHVSQASNKWSLNPKSILTSAVSITSNVGSGISSVVENVSSVVDSAIGAPPPEQMAALVNKDRVADKVENISEDNKQDLDQTQNKQSLGFGLFDYTLNTLESIGKKTMEVMVDDKHKKDVKTDKRD